MASLYSPIFLIFLFFILTAAQIDPAFSKENANFPDTYLLSAGDQILIEVYGENDLQKKVLLDETGKISYPFLGEITTSGLSMKQLEDVITRKLKGPFLLNPKVTVSILVYRSFFINGEINKPGGYPFQPGLTLRKAIAIAGGETEQAFLEKSTIIREKNANHKPEKIELEDRVSPGDIITISEYKQVFVNGEVKKPGAYPFQKNLTLRKAIALAGGFSERASKNKILVIHEANKNRKPLRSELDEPAYPGDIITVEQSFF